MRKATLDFCSINTGLACALACTPASAAFFAPTTTAQLIADINTTNANGVDDTIDLGGLTFTLTAVNNVTNGNNGLPSITGGGGQILFIQNGTIQRSGAPAFRLLHIADGVPIYLDNVILRDGQAGTGNGGAIYNRGAMTIRTSRLINNNGVYGGAVYNAPFASLNISDSTLQQNTASDNGGAIYLAANSSLTVTGSTLTGNMATSGGGGAIYNLSDFGVSLTNSTLSGNSASSDGGAVHSFGTINLIANCTIFGNGVGQAGGGVFLGLGSELSQLRSTIVASNNVGTQGPDLLGSPTAESNNLIGNNSDSGIPTGTPNANGSWVGPPAGPFNPVLGALANNGGPTATHAVLDNSFALDHGSNPSALEFDQRGTPYVRSYGAATDIGAFEYTPLLFTNGFE